MAVLVVDASVALAWALPDESSSYAEAVLAAVENGAIQVPELWPREIANGLAMAYVRRRMAPADEEMFLAQLSRLTIRVEQADALSVIREGTAAATRFGLTA
jgi:predicted nucleic acid-binding protein